MNKINYSNLIEFYGLFLEDSFVLNIFENDSYISFQMEFVLTESHPKYKTPLNDERYYYCNGSINFMNPETVIWIYKNDKAISIDANNESDIGNIDIFFKDDDFYVLEGDWGNVLIKSKSIEIKL